MKPSYEHKIGKVTYNEQVIELSGGSEDLDAELTTQDGLLNSLEETINKFPDVSDIEEWKPNPTWWNIEKILAEDTRDYVYKTIVLLAANSDDISYNNTNAVAYATSDGAFYEGTSINHTWDKSKDKPCIVDGVELYKTRYIIIYCKSIIAGVLLEKADVKWIIGDVRVSSSKQFEGCHSLISTKGICIYNTADDLTQMFNDCSNLRHIDYIDTSANKKFVSMFQRCIPLKTIPLLDTSSGTNFSSMFYGCYSLEIVPQLDTSNGDTFSSMFYGCCSLKTIPSLDTSNGTNFSSMFQNCYSLETVPELNTSNGTNLSYMFSNCYLLETIQLNNTSSCTNFNQMFYDCYALTNILGLNTTNGTTFSSMFYSCYSLETVPELNTSNGTSFSSMFANCRILKTVPQLNTSNGTNLSHMFQNCYILETVPPLDLINATNVVGIFDACKKLKNVNIKNIRISLTLSYSNSYGHLLTLDSLLNTIRELWDNVSGTSTLTLSIGSMNLKKLADVYVKLVDITDEMRAEDEYIDNKKPFVVCDSTDEGAMLVTEYVTSKNWQLK